MYYTTNTKRLIEIFLQLARFDGLSGNEKKIAEYIKSFLLKINLKPEEDDTSKYSGGNSGNLICKIGTGGNFAVISHMDTARSTKNLKVVVEEDRIQSDGTTILGADNRSGISIILYTIEKIFLENLNVKDFTVVFTICEETSLAGSKYISLDGNIERGFVFDSSLRPGNFIPNSYGAKTFDVKIKGKASHAGIAPESGINSIEVASKAISSLSLGRIDNDTTLNIGKIVGGTATNVIPENTVINGEVRSIEKKKVERIIKGIKKRFVEIAENYKAEVAFSSQWVFKPYKISHEELVYKQIETAIRNAGLKPNATISAGGSDANSFNAKGIPTVNIGIGAQNPHSNDEFILLEDLNKSAQILFELIRQ